MPRQGLPGQGTRVILRRQRPTSTGDKGLSGGFQSGGIALGGLFDRVARSWRLMVILLAVLYAGWIATVLERDRTVDFYVYYLAAYGFEHGINMYAPPPGTWAELAARAGVARYETQYYYPPLTALLVWPLTVLPARLAAGVWLVATAAAFMMSGWLLGGSSRLAAGRTLALGLVLGFVPALATLHAGQVNGLLLLTLAIAYVNLRRSHWGPGLGIGTGVMLKLVPVAHLAYLAWRGRWRTVLIGGASIAVLMLCSLPLVGLGGVMAYLGPGVRQAPLSGLMPSGANQSLNGLVSRLALALQGAGYLNDAANVAQWTWLALAAGLVGASAWLCWPGTRRSRGGPDDAQRVELEFALVTAAVTLIAPYTWYHQLAVLVIPFFVLTERALGTARLRWLLLPLALGYLATDLHGLAWHALEAYPLLVSMPCYTALLLWAALAWLIARHKRAAQVGVAR